jgi:hypothetical protein
VIQTQPATLVNVAVMADGEELPVSRLQSKALRETLLKL